MLNFKEFSEAKENKMIKIKKSETADTRTCDWSMVSEDQLLRSSKSHIEDVSKGMNFFSDMIKESSSNHDHDKISDIKGFHSEFKTGFATENWYRNHMKVNRHHLNNPNGTPKDVNLIDILEYISDCVMAGMARSGYVYTIDIQNELLQKAFQNTVEKLKANVELKQEV